jgi:MtaA/CmuA family methyltransferase
VNGRQRVLSAIGYLPVDQVATIPLVMRFAAALADVPYSAYLQDSKLLAEAQLSCQARFGYDYVTVCSDGYREAEACGAELSFPLDSTPKVERPTLASLQDVGRLEAPDPERNARLKDRLGSVRMLRRAVGDRLLVLGWVEGPFAAAAAMFGVEPLLLGLHTEPEAVRLLMEFCLAVEIAFARAQISAGADLIGVGDAAASLVSATHYREVVLPFETRLVAEIHKVGGKAKLHICGNTNHLLELMPLAGADVVNVDWMVDLAAARRALNARACLKGNCDPVEVLLRGTPATIAERARQDIAIGGRTGYILGAGCEVAPETPEENLHAYVEAARQTKQG